MLAEFRQMGIAGDYYLEFVLRRIPRRGPEQSFAGQLWGGRREGNEYLRISVRDAQGTENRYLIRRGSQAAAWKWLPADSAPVAMTAAELFEPIAGTTISPFDLQMPYLYWSDFVYEGLAKLRGRPSHRFLLYPPADFSAARPSLTGARISLDTQYGALVESELLSSPGKVQKTLSLVELKKVQDQWIPKGIDVRDEESRDKTRLAFTAAAMNCNFAPVLFEPAMLGEKVAAPEATSIERF